MSSAQVILVPFSPSRWGWIAYDIEGEVIGKSNKMLLSQSLAEQNLEALARLSVGLLGHPTTTYPFVFYRQDAKWHWKLDRQYRISLHSYGGWPSYYEAEDNLRRLSLLIQFKSPTSGKFSETKG
jgi:hypothetical protein